MVPFSQWRGGKGTESVPIWHFKKGKQCPAKKYVSGNNLSCQGNEISGNFVNAVDR